MEPKGLGVLDHPLEPVIGLAEGETRWRMMTTGEVQRIQISNSILRCRRPACTGDPVFQRRFVLTRDVTAYWMPRLKRA
jgi:hypothetical protein